MSIGTLFTLFVTPAIYTFLARDHSHDREKSGKVVEPKLAHVDRAAE